MKELTLFYLRDCPYCVNARRALHELEQEDPAYGEIPIRWIEESEQKTLADSYDYYYVPSVFLGAEKLWEARPADGYAAIRRKLRQALDTARAKG